MNAPETRTALRIASTLAVAAVSLASAACSSGAFAVPAPHAPPTYSGAAACHATARAKILARKVYVPGGVEAASNGGGFAVRYAASASRCLSVAWGAAGDEPSAASCPARGTRTAFRDDASDETMLAWESHDEPEPRIRLGVVAYDVPMSLFGDHVGPSRSTTRLVERTFFVPGSNREDGQRAPALAPIGHDRVLLAWVGGNEESHELRAQSVVGWGDALGPSMVLSPPDASVIGQPSVVVAPSGDGLVTYVVSIDGEFDVLGTPVACATN
ncbi:MAG: hypothetical protein ACREJ3_09480 [Polyangiaceae bacterium]